MQRKNFKYRAFKYDELPEEAKQKALEQMYDINIDYQWWDSDYYLELSEKEIKSRHIKLSSKWWEHGGNIPGEYPAYTGLFNWREIYFDLDRRHYVQFIGLEVTDDDIFRRWLRIPKRLWDKCCYSFSNDGRFVSTQLEIEKDGEPCTDREGDILERAEGIFSDKVHEAWRMLRDDWEYRLTREAVEETIRINEYDFFEDGRRTRVLAA